MKLFCADSNMTLEESKVHFELDTTASTSETVKSALKLTDKSFPNYAKLTSQNAKPTGPLSILHHIKSLCF